MNAKYKIVRNADGFPICLLEESSGVRICTFNSQLATIKEHADHIEQSANALLDLGAPRDGKKGAK